MKCCRSAGLQKCYFDGSADRVRTFGAVGVFANPSGATFSALSNAINGDYSGLAAALVNVPADGSDSGLVLDFTYTRPLDRITAIRITTNYGSILNDGDNIFNPDAQLFDEFSAPLTPVFVAAAANGGAFFTTPVPGGPVDGVKTVRLSNIRGNGPNPVTVGIREVEMLQSGIGPAAAIWCPDSGGLSWVDSRTGAAVAFADLTDCV